ncbi:MAG TPA: peptidyl-prolyl cis-trans isomerase [Gemmatimonadaceae bacterium]|nr:peptidyl-prolyl cis-trans isomerase [Gemmatimonadaceae bacterium]
MRGTTFRYVVWIVVALTFVGVFIFLDSSGLIGGERVTTGTAVAEVNGEDIPYIAWEQAAQNLVERQQEQLGRSLSLDEIERLRGQAFDQLVDETLLRQEYERRGIRVSDAEIEEAARNIPLPEFMQSAELQTEGRFDRDKYLRFLASPTARQGGLYQYIENRYRTEIPRRKLFEQIASAAYLSDERLWRAWQDQHDSAQVSFVAFLPNIATDSSVQVSDREIEEYYAQNKARFERPARAVISVVQIPRTITAADSAAARARAIQLRNEVLAGTPFDSVAARESHDSASGPQGGSLGRGARGRFVPEFEKAAYALRVGELSQPVLTQFGYHVIRVDDRKGDTLALRHILLRVGQSDSSATATDRRADSLAAIAGGAGSPQRLDSAARRLGLSVQRAVAIEGEPVTAAGRYVAGASGFAFGGARPREISDLLDAPESYALVRLDSLHEGGVPPVEAVRDEVRRLVARRKAVEALVPRADSLARAAAESSLEEAARARGLQVQKSNAFTRVAFVPGLGTLNEAVGAAFALPVGAVGAPVRTSDGVFVLRVDRRANADRAAWEAQKAQQRQQVIQQYREQRVREFLANLRKEADIEDRRKEIVAATRATDT